MYSCTGLFAKYFSFKFYIENVVPNLHSITHISCTYVHQPQFSFLSKIYPKN